MEVKKFKNFINKKKVFPLNYNGRFFAFWRDFRDQKKKKQQKRPRERESETNEKNFKVNCRKWGSLKAVEKGKGEVLSSSWWRRRWWWERLMSGRTSKRRLRENRVHAFSPIVICSIMHIYIKVYASCRIRIFRGKREKSEWVSEKSQFVDLLQCTMTHQSCTHQISSMGNATLELF